MALLMRTSGDPLQLVTPMKDLVHALDPNLPLLEVRSLEDFYRFHAVEGPRIAVRLIGTMGAVGLLLTIAGLYGLLSYNVTRRTREIGIRMAIGAGPQNVLRMVMGKGVTLVAIGTAIGLVMGFAVERLMNTMLFSAGGIDFVAYLIVVPSMLAVTLLAAYVPARRATGIPPTLALRCD
jgi:putative ABC transport system permease protein